MSDPGTAVEIEGIHPFSNANLDHLAMTNLIVGGLVRTGRRYNIFV